MGDVVESPRASWMSASLIVLVALAVVVLNPVQALAARTVLSESAASLREREPVVLSGALFEELHGSSGLELGVFRYDASSGSFQPIPFQFDERLERVFNEGTVLEFREWIYDLEGVEDGRLDADDELAFMARDAGAQAPADAAWPEGAAGLRYEVRVTDDLPGSPVPERWVYLFAGAGLPRSDVSYVTWNKLAAGAMGSDHFEIVFEDRWQLTELRVHAPCGDGQDFLDRFKGRAEPNPGLHEDEEGWNYNSSFLGGLVGPIRAIRYVRGAMSAVNTIHRDVVYDQYWERTIHLRVHPITRAWFYFDWLPASGTTLFLPAQASGIAVDGVADAGLGSAAQDWFVLAGPHGGLALGYDIPASPLYGSKELYYRDDADFDDKLATNPNYPDDDDSAFGNHGATIRNVQESNITPIRITWHALPLCSGEGDAQLGEHLDLRRLHPLTLQAAAQSVGSSPVRSLKLESQSGDVLLRWQASPSTSSYRVYTTGNPADPQGAWTLLGSTEQLNFRGEGHATPGPNRFYSVVPVSAGGQEGPW